MVEREVVIVNKLGLHARAAAKLVNLASQFESDIHLLRNGQEVNGKSIMGVMMLAAAKGTPICIRASGPDEKEAVEKIEELIANRFQEEE